MKIIFNQDLQSVTCNQLLPLYQAILYPGLNSVTCTCTCIISKFMIFLVVCNFFATSFNRNLLKKQNKLSAKQRAVFLTHLKSNPHLRGHLRYVHSTRLAISW